MPVQSLFNFVNVRECPLRDARMIRRTAIQVWFPAVEGEFGLGLGTPTERAFCELDTLFVYSSTLLEATNTNQRVIISGRVDMHARVTVIVGEKAD